MSASHPVVAVYPGSFDPITRGHEDIVRRALHVADRLIVAVAHTATQSKSGLFSVDERLDLLREVFAGEDNVEACAFEGLLVEFARTRGVRFVIRGLRAVSDFEYELQMTQMNRELWPDMETIFLAPEVDYSFLSSSLVREVARLGGDIGRFVSPVVAERVRAKLKGE
ncbi:MAG: pantetheine-phosphate adenylyltransferase [Gemmatimonadetes bacterium]|jgi:pantetheine-phosphate adenylyltransferase|nr:pantetheine-phosphate adenylyltransferase [Gemmatimonadota bacterium]